MSGEDITNQVMLTRQMEFWVFAEVLCIGVALSGTVRYLYNAWLRGTFLQVGDYLHFVIYRDGWLNP